MREWQMALLIYAFVWSLRVARFRRIWNVSSLRGVDWFFDIHLKPGCETQRDTVLGRFRARIIVPYVIEAAVVGIVLVLNRTNPMLYFVVIVTVMTIVAAFNISLAATKAKIKMRRFEVTAQEVPVTSIAFSLKTRRLRDYTNWYIESAIAAITLSAVGILIWQYTSFGSDQDFRPVLGRPLLLIYFSIGVLLLKFSLVGWRSRIPAKNSSAFLEINDLRRRYFLKACDGLRLFFAFTLCEWAYLLWQAEEGPAISSRAIVLILNLAFGAVFAVWAAKGHRAVVSKYLAVAPPKLLTVVEPEIQASGRFCWQPDYPVAIVRSSSGHAINLACAANQAAVFYAIGLILVLMILK